MVSIVLPISYSNSTFLVIQKLTANSQITEVLENLLHTLVRFALPSTFPEEFLFIEDRSPEYGGDVSKEEPILPGSLYEAAQEAIKMFFYASSYNHMGER